MSHEFFTLLQENKKDTLTYLVANKITNQNGSIACFLVHPLAPKAYICLAADSEQELAAHQFHTQGKSPIQVQLEYAKRYHTYLDYDTNAEVESLALYFVTNRNLTADQKNKLSRICGRIASHYCHNDLSIAIRNINENEALLDEYNTMWYNNFKKIFRGEKRADTAKQRASIFNMAGFVFAQLDQR